MTDNKIGIAQGTKSGSTVTVNIGGVMTAVQVARDVTPAAGDALIVTPVGSQWFAVGRAFAAAPTLAEDNDTAPEPKPGSVSGTLVVPPTDTASWDGVRWLTGDDDVRQGQYGGSGNHTGAVFYGGKLTSLSGATVLSATVRVRRLPRGISFGPETTTMRLVTDLSRPTGAPTLSSSTTGPRLALNGTAAAFAVPAAWVQSMVDGTAGGLGFFDADGSPFVVLAGRASYGPAFALTIKWSR